MNGRVGVNTVRALSRHVTVTVSKVRVHREKKQSPSLRGGPTETGRPAQGEKDGKFTMEAACLTNSLSHQDSKDTFF